MAISEIKISCHGDYRASVWPHNRVRASASFAVLLTIALLLPFRMSLFRICRWSFHSRQTSARSFDTACLNSILICTSSICIISPMEGRDTP